MKVIGYVRVSTEQQAEKGVSLAAQRQKIKAMALVQGHRSVDFIVDGGESGKNLQRPGIERLLEEIDGGEVKAVIIAKLDRLTRNVRDLADLLDRFNQKGVALISVAESLDTATAAGRLVINIMASVSQWEREAIGERIRDAIRYKKSQGEAYSPTPYGFTRAGKKLRPHPTQAKTVRLILRRRRAGWTFKRIAAALNSDGVKTKRGGSWYASTVRGIVNNGIHTR